MPKLPGNSGGDGLVNRLDEMSAQFAVAFSPCMFAGPAHRRSGGAWDYMRGVSVIGFGSRCVADRVSSRPGTFRDVTSLILVGSRGSFELGVVLWYFVRCTNYYLPLRDVVGRESRSVGGPHYDTMSNCNCNCYLHGYGMGYACFHHDFAFAYILPCLNGGLPEGRGLTCRSLINSACTEGFVSR